MIQVELNNIELIHAPLIKEWKSDEVLSAQILSTFKPIILQEAEQWIERTNADNNQVLKGIFVLANDIEKKLIGMVRLMFINAKDSNAELGIYIANSLYKGKGIGKIALINILNIGFNEKELQKIYLKVEVTNTPAVNLYESVGFKIEENLNNYLLPNKQRKDLFFMTIKKENWNG